MAGFINAILKGTSGASELKVSTQLLYDKVIGFRGVAPGVGTSTILQNVAYALSETTNFSICVLDTSYMFPTQASFMMTSDGLLNIKDAFSFDGDVEKIASATKFRNVHLVSFANRTMIDMLSPRDSEAFVEKVIAALKTFFDIILIDIALEPSNVAVFSAVKCNRIFNVTDTSLKSLSNFQKSINTMVSLAVPLAKANKLIINRVQDSVNIRVDKVLSGSDLEVLCEIPELKSVMLSGVTGRPAWKGADATVETRDFSSAIDLILNTIIQRTVKNAKFMDKNSVLEAVSRFKKENPVSEEQTVISIEEKPNLDGIAFAPITEDELLESSDDNKTEQYEVEIDLSSLLNVQDSETEDGGEKQC